MVPMKSGSRSVSGSLIVFIFFLEVVQVFIGHAGLNVYWCTVLVEHLLITSKFWIGNVLTIWSIMFNVCLYIVLYCRKLLNLESIEVVRTVIWCEKCFPNNSWTAQSWAKLPVKTEQRGRITYQAGLFLLLHWFLFFISLPFPFPLVFSRADMRVRQQCDSPSVMSSALWFSLFLHVTLFSFSDVWGSYLLHRPSCHHRQTFETCGFYRVALMFDFPNNN